ncbi:helix-turn-helix domain-containing protein [Sphingobacterium bovistauri]|uniref:Helix-turn-helix domain-containing protein n=1 Tax=Sphingobacterium bovistauri TaxID=2781959 RepID=A0ABS7Z3S0_9SPHI|nr:helix-turn-helix domain-containing protein [Sphingobacterium bovistauri]MCA5004232.1 helix-turn-helix domain-containing protein [Sphingobacterium bovistauri]
MTKSSINEIIKTARKTKGLTQQDLGDEAGISLRTVQRIEKGTEEISGFSLKQISKVLDIPLENLVMQNVDKISIDTNQIGSIKALYTSSLFFLLMPILGFIAPTIIGFSKQNKSEIYKKHFSRILQFHILSIVVSLYFPIFIIFKILHYKMPLDGNTILIALIFYYGITISYTLYNVFKLNKNPSV